MDSFGILHLSDLHCKKEASAEALLGPLMEDLDKKFSKAQLAFVVISGDFIDRGDAAGYGPAAAFIRELSKATKVGLERFVVCPGNHDVEELESAFALQGKVGEGEEEVKKLDEDAYRVRVLSEYPKRFSGYSKLSSEFFGHTYDLADLSRVQTFADRGVQFLSLNSACRIDKFRLESKHAVIDPAAFSRALAVADTDKQPVRIAVWHHAVLGRWSMAESDGYLQRLAEAGFAMLLHGDVHETRAQMANPFRDALPVAGAGAFGANEAAGNLYNLIEVAGARVTVHVRKQDAANGPFDGHFAFGKTGKRVPHFSFTVGEAGDAPAPPAPAGDPTRYLAALDESTKWIDFRGLQVGSGKAKRFEIERLYVPLTHGSVPIEEALAAKHVVIQGDAGSGKTTFLRQHARRLMAGGEFPILIKIAEFDQHWDQCWDRKQGPTVKTSPHWVRHYLASRGWDLSEEYFEAKLRDSHTVLLLDGLDEAANDQRRAAMAKLFHQAAVDYPACRMVVTTRPAAYRDEAVLAGWETVRIDDLDDPHVDEFLRMWSACLHAENTEAAEGHRAELRSALDSKPEIRRMARNPVMLTALAVVHWNDKRLPDQRAELYESVLGWLAKARERAGRETAESCLRMLGRLALGMQEWKDGHRVQLGKDAAAGLIAEEFRTVAAEGRRERARQFLTEEEVDSGIISSVGTDVRFWHRTFQEHLSARTLAGGLDADLWKRVEPRMNENEWREVMLLLGGVLHSRGRERLDWLFAQMLGSVPERAGLADQARCFGLVGAMLRDLGAVKYELPGDAAERFGRMREAVLGIFEPAGAAKVAYKDRVAAGEALGANHPGLRMPWDPGYWVEIPGGAFLMGAQKTDAAKPNYDDEAQDDEPVRKATVKAFRMGRYPVTAWEYGRYLEEAGAEAPSDWDDQRLHPNRPVTNVNWHAAKAYCEWAAKTEPGCRLPAEEEWEYAARGTDGRKYPWGPDNPDAERMNYESNVGAPSPVGVFPASHVRGELADMAGNVWEWTSSLYTKGGKSLVLRGGSWSYSSYAARCAFRFNCSPEYRNYSVGFRCART